MLAVPFVAKPSTEKGDKVSRGAWQSSQYAATPSKPSFWVWWGTSRREPQARRVFYQELNNMKHYLLAGVAAIAMAFAGQAMAATATAAVASSTVASGSAAIQAGPGTSAGASNANNTTNSNAQALALGPVFSATNANSTTHGSAANANASNATHSLTSSFSVQLGTGTAAAFAH